MDVFTKCGGSECDFSLPSLTKKKRQKRLFMTVKSSFPIEFTFFFLFSFHFSLPLHMCAHISHNFSTQTSQQCEKKLRCPRTIKFHVLRSLLCFSISSFFCLFVCLFVCRIFFASFLACSSKKLINFFSAFFKH